MVPADSRRIARVLRYSGTRYLRSRFAYGAVTLFGRPFHAVRLRSLRMLRALQPLGTFVPRFGLVPLRSPLLGESRFLSFPAGT